MTHSALVRQQAVGWLARLDSGEMSEQDRLAMEEWMAADARHRAEIEAARSAWRCTEFLSHLSEQDKAQVMAVAQASDTAISRKLSPSNAWVTRAMALAAAVLVAVIGLVVLRQAVPGEVYRTGVGEQRRIALEDGSGVTLNTDSLLRVRYTPAGRLLRLERGEAFFTVARDPSRPFRVRVEDSEVRALGTAFGIRRHDHAFEVVVTEGVVEVAGGERSAAIRVTPGEMAKLQRGGAAAAVTPAPQPNLAWREGLLEFKGETLERVVQEFSRYTRKQIVFADDDVKRLRLGGVFKAGDVEALTSAVDLMLPVKVVRITPYLTVLSMDSGSD